MQETENLSSVVKLKSFKTRPIFQLASDFLTVKGLGVDVPPTTSGMYVSAYPISSGNKESNANFLAGRGA